MIIIYVVALTCLGWAWFRKPEVLTFNLKRACQYWLIQTCIMLVIGWSVRPYSIQANVYQTVDEFTYTQATLAGLEDAAFVLPLTLVPPVVKAPLLVVSSILFVLGHKYQGSQGMYSKVLYIPIAYLFASKYGIFTTMLPHALTDVAALGFIKQTLKRCPGILDLDSDTLRELNQYQLDEICRS